jgi:hypothetical protein
MHQGHDLGKLGLMLFAGSHISAHGISARCYAYEEISLSKGYAPSRNGRASLSL